MSSFDARRRRRAVAAVAALVVAAALAGCARPKPPAAAEPKGPEKLVLGFVPSVEAEKIPEKVGPIADFLSQELGIPVEHFTSQTYVGLIEAMGAGKVDIGFLNPLGYVLAKDVHDVYLLLQSVRRGATSYRSQIVVRADSGIDSLDDLKGKRFGFGDPGSTSSYLFPAAHMRLKGIDFEKDFSEVKYLGGHDKVIIAVYNGDVDAGATFDDARTRVKETYPDVMEKVKVLEYTGDIPNDTVSVRKGLDPELVARIKAALTKFAETEEGKKALFDLYQIDGFADAEGKDANFDIIRDTAKAMGLDIQKELGGN